MYIQDYKMIFKIRSHYSAINFNKFLSQYSIFIDDIYFFNKIISGKLIV